LQARRGRSLVVAGDYQPASVHALARSINQTLGNVGTTVTYGPSLEAAPTSHSASLADLVRAMDAGQVEVLVMLGGINPVYSAPADLKFAEKLSKVNLSVYHGLYSDETAYLSHWNIPDAHPLESWGDARAFDGTVTLIQPLIAPLYDGRSASEVLATFTAQGDRRGYTIVKDYWTRSFSGGPWTIRSADGQPFKNVDTFWRHALHDGFISGTAFANGGPATPFVAAPAGPTSTPASGGAAPATAGAPAAAPVPTPVATNAAPAQTAAPVAQGGLELIFRPDPTVWDGRFTNNGWLQELPKPLTKVTWDATAWVSPQLAHDRNLEDGDVIELRYRGNTARMPIVRVPGHPHELPLGGFVPCDPILGIALDAGGYAGAAVVAGEIAGVTAGVTAAT
jgi:molybdopterin-containing oxidoreductase family iron-sulfur binding subunit